MNLDVTSAAQIRAAVEQVDVLDITNGKVVWEYEDGGAIMSSPAIASGRVVFGSSDGHVVCVG